jgi:hypothetical protein
LKTIPHRSQILVIGGGMSGMCTAISAARQGCTVNLIEARNTLGGRIGEEVRLPFDQPSGCNLPFPRESGLLDEILVKLQKFNFERTYAGQSRVFHSIILGEPRVKLFSNIRIIEANTLNKTPKIDSCAGLCMSTGIRHIFKAQYVIDCTGTGNIAKLAGAPGETGIDLGASENVDQAAIQHRIVALLKIVKKNEPYSFICPDWVKVRWEDNQLNARVEWLESLNHSMTGYHHLEWISPIHTHLPSAEEIVWSAWDFLKNRSPMKNAAVFLAIDRISPVLYEKSDFRGLGDYTLTQKDLLEGKRHIDSIAVSRSLLEGEGSLLCSNRGKIVLPQPFEIPLRCLYSKKIRNLLWTGEHSSVSYEVAPSLGHSPTSAQMGIAAGHFAAYCINQKRLPRTVAKKGHIEGLRRSLELSNHITGLSEFSDGHDLVNKSKITASTSWDCKNISSLKQNHGPSVTSCLVQFPAIGEKIEGIKITLFGEEGCSLEARLFKGSAFNCNLPGECLDACVHEINAGGQQEIMFPLHATVDKPGWHYLEIRSKREFSVIQVINPPIGFKVSYPVNPSSGGTINSYSKYIPLSSENFTSWGPLMEVFPHTKIYNPDAIKSDAYRPSFMPNIWISKPTDFSYPEFLEISWEKDVEISKIALFFDPSYDQHFSFYPTSVKNPHIPSLIKDYRIYLTSAKSRSTLLLEVTDNYLPYREHIFEPTTVTGLEVEILSTHGLDRAQIYKVRAYD